LTAAAARVHHFVVADGRHRVFLPQALGADEFVRVTWHEAEQVVVFSQWRGSLCVAATPVRVTEIEDLAGLLVDALGEAPSATANQPSSPGVRERLAQLVQRRTRRSA
jgi:hypothetical protein